MLLPVAIGSGGLSCPGEDANDDAGWFMSNPGDLSPVFPSSYSRKSR